MNEVGRVINQLREELKDPTNLETRREKLEIQLGLLSARRQVLTHKNAGAEAGLNWDVDVQTLDDLSLVTAEHKKWVHYIQDNEVNMCAEVFKQYKRRFEEYANRKAQLEKTASGKRQRENIQPSGDAKNGNKTKKSRKSSKRCRRE